MTSRHVISILICLYIIISMLVGVYIIWQSQERLSEFFSDHYNYLYIFVIASIIFWLVIFFLRDKLRFVIVISALFVLFSAFFLEFCLYLYVPSGVGGMGIERAQKAIDLGMSPDLRSKIDLFLEDERLVPAILAMNFDSTNGLMTKEGNQILPLGGISRRNTLFCNESGYFSKYESDRFGFNNNNIEWDSEVIDWLLVGDSFTHGACVNRENNIASSIKMTSGGSDSVINLGIAGNGPMLELATLKEYATIIKPKVVLWFYYEGNDLNPDLEREKQFTFLRKYLHPDFHQDLFNRQVEIDSVLNSFYKEELDTQMFIHKTRFFRFYYLRRALNVAQLTLFPEKITTDKKIKEVVDPLFLDILKKARDMVHGWGGRFYFVYLPAHNRVLGDDNGPINLYSEKSLRVEIVARVGALNIPVLDLQEKIFAIENNPLELFPFKMPGHYTAEGYKKIGKVVFQCVGGVGC